MAKMKKILFALTIAGMFVVSTTPIETKANSLTLFYHHWHDKKLYVGVWNIAKYANDESYWRGMNAKIEGKTVYQILNNLFLGCNSMYSFYQRMQNLTIDAWEGGINSPASDLPIWCKGLKIITRTVWEKYKQNKKASLFCHQQAILLAAAIKARFSVPYGSTYVLKPEYKDFIFYFAVGQNGQLTGHVQLIIDKWNGSDTPNGADRWEIDTWEGWKDKDQYRAWNENYGWGYNSKMWISTSREKYIVEKLPLKFLQHISRSVGFFRI